MLSAAQLHLYAVGMTTASPLLMESLAATRSYVGTAVGPTPWIEIDALRVRRFLEATSSETSAQAAKYAPGTLLLSLVPDLLPQLIALAGWTRGVNAGVDDCRFEAPVPVGSRVRMSARLERARGMPGGGVRLSFEVRFELEGSELPACTAMVHYAYFP
jgi:acyl dehydratase